MASKQGKRLGLPYGWKGLLPPLGLRTDVRFMLGGIYEVTRARGFENFIIDIFSEADPTLVRNGSIIDDILPKRIMTLLRNAVPGLPDSGDTNPNLISLNRAQLRSIERTRLPVDTTEKSGENISEWAKLMITAGVEKLAKAHASFQRKTGYSHDGLVVETILFQSQEREISLSQDEFDYIKKFGGEDITGIGLSFVAGMTYAKSTVKFSTEHEVELGVTYKGIDGSLEFTQESAHEYSASAEFLVAVKFSHIKLVQKDGEPLLLIGPNYVAKGDGEDEITRAINMSGLQEVEHLDFDWFEGDLDQKNVPILRLDGTTIDTCKDALELLPYYVALECEEAFAAEMHAEGFVDDQGQITKLPGTDLAVDELFSCHRVKRPDEPDLVYFVLRRLIPDAEPLPVSSFTPQVAEAPPADSSAQVKKLFPMLAASAAVALIAVAVGNYFFPPSHA